MAIIGTRSRKSHCVELCCKERNIIRSLKHCLIGKYAGLQIGLGYTEFSDNQNDNCYTKTFT